MKKATSLFLFAITLVALVLAAGCGNQTEQANKLIDDANQLSADAQYRVTQRDALIVQAGDQQALGQSDAQKASLTKIKSLNDEAITLVTQAKEKTDQAIVLNISDSQRRQLQARSAAQQATLDLFSTEQEMVALLLSDLSLSGPGAEKKYTDLQKRASDQSAFLDDANAEADRLAKENVKSPE